MATVTTGRRADAPLDGSDPGDAQRFRIEGMDCAACARTIEKAVSAVAGVHCARVSFGNGTLLVDGSVDPGVVERVVAAAGYRARPATLARAVDHTRPFWRSSRQAVASAVATLILLVAVVASLAGESRPVTEPVYLLSMVLGGSFVARAAVFALRRRSLDMNVLMTLAAVGAVGIGAYSEGAWVLVLFSVGTTLETFALDRTRRSVQALMDLAPAQACVIDEGGERLVPVGEVAPGSVFAIRPGERVALDGIVLEGASSVDEAAITGESMPLEKHPGDEVFAGSLNANGSLTVRATRPADASTLARIAQLVEDAQGSRAPSERFVDRFARLYTPLVFAAAMLVMAIPVALGEPAHTWIYRALALLIVACPCSLVISIPVAVVSAIGGLARRGVLVKGGQALEDLARIRTVALDKTGTLTLGLPALSRVQAVAQVDEREALRLLASLERQSEHPLAAAILRAARDQDIALSPAQGFHALPGRGLFASIEGRELWAGGPRLAYERLARPPAALGELQADGQTTIVLGEGTRAIAVFGFTDTVRLETRDALTALRIERLGISRIVMLTGDSKPVAANLASALGLTEWRAELFPADKLEQVRALNADAGPVAMVGDGINDAPALAAASVGIAMGAAGTDAALAAADVALMSDDLRRLPEALAGARRARSVMRQNVIASLTVKAIFIVLAPLGLITLVIAVAADMGMSLAVTLNGLRLIRPPAYAATESDRPASSKGHSVDGCGAHSPRADGHATTIENGTEPGCENGCCVATPDRERHRAHH